MQYFLTALKKSSLFGSIKGHPTFILSAALKNFQGFYVEKTTLYLLYPLEHENGLVLGGYFQTWLKNAVPLLFLLPSGYYLYIAFWLNYSLNICLAFFGALKKKFFFFFLSITGFHASCLCYQRPCKSMWGIGCSCAICLVFVSCRHNSHELLKLLLSWSEPGSASRIHKEVSRSFPKGITLSVQWVKWSGSSSCRTETNVGPKSWTEIWAFL